MRRSLSRPVRRQFRRRVPDESRVKKPPRVRVGRSQPNQVSDEGRKTVRHFKLPVLIHSERRTNRPAIVLYLDCSRYSTCVGLQYQTLNELCSLVSEVVPIGESFQCIFRLLYVRGLPLEKRDTDVLSPS